MKPFSQFVTKVIAEAKFRESSTVEHLYDMPMFSVFRSRDISGKYNRIIKDLRPTLASARNDLMKMGFPAMHANVVFDNIDRVNRLTGGEVAGYAVPANRYMVIDLGQRKYKEQLKRTIIHEWAHLWMFNNSDGFTQAVKDYYKQILQRGGEGLESEPVDVDDNYNTITDAFTDDEIYTLIVKSITLMCANVYALALLMYKEEEDEFFMISEDDLKGEISRKIQHLVTASLEMIQKFFTGKGKTLTIDEALSDRAAKRLEDYLTPIVLKKVTRSIDDDIYDFEDRFEDRNQLVDYLDRNETSNNAMFKPKGKSYNELYNMFIDIDPSDFTGKVFKELSGVVRGSEIKSNIKTLRSVEKLSGKEYNELRDRLSKLLNWATEVNSHDAYSLANEDELWAVGIDRFFDLKPQYRREMLKLMATRGQRELLNRTQRKYANIQRQRDLSN